MSIRNVGYSTLEDAWGENFDSPRPKRSTKHTRKDPVCDMYAKKYVQPSPPYAEKKRAQSKYARADQNLSLKRDYTKYFGFDDVQSNKSTSSKHQPPQYKEPIKNQTITEPDGYASDDSISPIAKNIPPAPQKLNITDYLSDSDEEMEPEFENIHTYSNNPTEEEQFFKSKDIPQAHSKLIATTPEEREKQYLDAGIFTVSGILLIFIMEQFIQIGIRLKNF